MFNNPLGYVGYPPGVTGTATNVNSTVRAATAAEAATGTLTDCYLSPATANSATGLDFASPPVLGFGSTTPRPVAATTLISTLNTSLATSAAATAINVGAVAPTGARTTTFLSGDAAVNDIFNIFGGNPSAGSQTLNIFGGTATGGTQAVNIFNNTAAGTIRLGTGAAIHQVRIGGATAQVGFFNTAPASVQTQGVITNSVTAGGVAGTIANFTDLAVYANDSAAIRNDIYQLALGLQSTIAALRLYGLLQ